MPDAPDPLGPLIDHLGHRQRVALGSFHRYFIWADDLRGQYHKLMRQTPIGQLKQAGVSEAEALRQIMSDSRLQGHFLAALYAFPYMSYYYGAMYVVIEGWQKRLRYADAEIDTLLESRFVALLERHRHGAFHFTPDYFDPRLMDFVNEVDSERWLNQLHAAFGRWLSFHLRLKPKERPRGI